MRISRISFMAVIAIGLSLGIAGPVQAYLFFDNFENPAFTAAYWGNERGDWGASGGVYNAGSPGNSPPTYSSVNGLTNLTDFIVSLDVNDVSDGGIWLRSNYTGAAASGVLLVIRNDATYWHIVQNEDYGSGLNWVYSSVGANAGLKIVVSGNTYSLYVNGGTSPFATLTTDMFASGGVGLYDRFPLMSFDNFMVSNVPIPGAVWLFGAGLIGLIGVRRKMK